MLNGLGGSADFLRSSKYSIMHTPSSRPTKTDPTGISCIVPMCTHVDQTEHDLDVVVTEVVRSPRLSFFSEPPKVLVPLIKANFDFLKQPGSG